MGVPVKKQKQWSYVRTCAERINAAIGNKDLLVIQFSDGEPPRILVNLLVVAKNDRGCWEVRYPASERSTYQWYEHNPDYDHGYDWSLKEIYDRLFKNIKIYRLSDVSLRLAPDQWEAPFKE